MSASCNYKYKMVTNNKGKTYEEMYGIEMARKLKQKRSEFMKLNCPMKNEESRLKSSLSHLGKKQTEEQRKKQSETMKGITPKNIDYLIEKGMKTRFINGQSAWNKGISPSEDTRKKIGLSGLGRKHTLEWKEEARIRGLNKKHLEETKKKISLARMGYKPAKESIEKYKLWRRTFITPKKDTTIEVKMQNFLKQLGITFFTHQYMKGIEHGYQCDIMIPVQKGIDKKTIIECFGDYWHNYPYAREIDIQRCNELRNAGWRVLVFWECEIKPMELNTLQEKL